MVTFTSYKSYIYIYSFFYFIREVGLGKVFISGLNQSLNIVSSASRILFVCYLYIRHVESVISDLKITFNPQQLVVAYSLIRIRLA